MTPDERIEYLIDFSRNGVQKATDDEILKVYDEMCGIVCQNQGNYSEQLRKKLREKAWIEPLGIICDGILYERKEGNYKDN